MCPLAGIAAQPPPIPRSGASAHQQVAVMSEGIWCAIMAMSCILADSVKKTPQHGDWNTDVPPGLQGPDPIPVMNEELP
jgi:hypothetical protein